MKRIYAVTKFTTNSSGKHTRAYKHVAPIHASHNPHDEDPIARVTYHLSDRETITRRVIMDYYTDQYIRWYDIESLSGERLKWFMELAKLWYDDRTDIPLSLFVSMNGCTEVYDEVRRSVNFNSVAHIEGPLFHFPKLFPERPKSARRSQSVVKRICGDKS